MSPLWSDLALARAAWANAVERGLVDAAEQPKITRPANSGSEVRRLLRPPQELRALSGGFK
jgi:hypothetical protein